MRLVPLRTHIFTSVAFPLCLLDISSGSVKHALIPFFLLPLLHFSFLILLVWLGGWGESSVSEFSTFMDFDIKNGTASSSLLQHSMLPYL